MLIAVAGVFARPLSACLYFEKQQRQASAPPRDDLLFRDALKSVPLLYQDALYNTYLLQLIVNLITRTICKVVV